MKRKLLSVALACTMLLLSLAGCGSKRDSAQSVVEKGINAVQAADLEAMRSYWGDNEFDASDEDDAQSEELMKIVAAALTYKIIDAKEDEKAGTAVVTVEFTNVDMGKVMSDFISDMFSVVMEYAFLPEDQQPSEDELNDLYMDKFTELMAREDNAKITTSADINLTLKDDKWVIVPSDSVLDAMFGGMFSIADSASDGADTELSKIGDIRNWVVSDIWNTGICNMSSYYITGKDATGSTMDPDFTVQQLTAAMAAKPEYDAFMASLSQEYAELSDLWTKVSEQIDVLYNQILEYGTESTGQQLDTGLYTQYFDAFDDAYSSMN